MKVKSPLLSFSASGSLADLITFLNIRGSTYAKTKQGKIGGTSPAQLEQRAKFKAACVASHLLTDEEKLYYHNLDIRSASCSWFNNFMSTFLLEEEAPPESMINSIQHLTFVIADAAVEHVIEIDEVDLDLSVLVCTGFSSSLSTPPYTFPFTLFVDSTHVGAYRRFGAASTEVRISVYVVEFNSSAVKSVQFFSVNLLNDVIVFSTTISEVDVSKSIILHLGHYVFSDVAVCNIFVKHHFLNSTTVFSRRGSSTGRVISPFFVLEFK